MSAPLFGLAGATKSGRIAVAAIIPILVFGFVDAAYLANEKAYRDLYNSIVAKIRNRAYTLADFGNLIVSGVMTARFEELRGAR